MLHDFTLRDLLSSQHPDILAYWLPTYCFLGKTVAAGHVPAWDPFVMGGVPFAADPQSGWAYLPAMLLFSTLRCDVAMRAMIVGQPILAGLGVYWFARSEGLSRPAATSGGLVASLALAGSRLSLFLPFPGALAWTSLTLAACSRLVHAKAWSSRLVWALLTAAAWGQLAAAHFAHGLLIGTGALLAYLAARAWPELRGKRRSGRGALQLAAILVGSMALLNLAFLVPRLAYWSQTSVGVGYSTVKETAGLPAIAWPLKFATSPGTYLGAAALALAFAGLWSKRYRSLAIAFGAFGALGYLLGLQAVSNVLAPLVRHVPGLNFYVHYPSRFALALFLSIPVLVALGIQAWAEARSAHERLWMVAPGLVVWGILPLALGVHPARLALLGLGAVAGGLALVAWARRPTLALVLPLVLAVELSANGLLGLGASPQIVDAGVRSPALRVGDIMAGWVEPLASPTVDAGEYLRAGSLRRGLPGLEGARYLTFVPGLLTSRGYLTWQAPHYWPLLANQRGLLFGVQDVQGYNPVQPLRYWTFVRAMSPTPMDYNAAVFPDPPAVALDLLQVRYLLSAAAGSPRPGATRVATQGDWAVWELPGAPPRASVLSNWTTVGSPAEALKEVTAPGFDPRATVVLERDPGLGPPAPAGSAGASAAFTSHGPQASAVAVSTPVSSVVLIRTPYERFWHASVDGRPVPIIPADYLDQAVPVSAGEHTISLTYDNPTIGAGLAGSGMVLAAMLGAAWWLRRRERSAGRVGQAERPPSVTDPRTAP